MEIARLVEAEWKVSEVVAVNAGPEVLHHAEHVKLHLQELSHIHQAETLYHDLCGGLWGLLAAGCKDHPILLLNNNQEISHSKWDELFFKASERSENRKG